MERAGQYVANYGQQASLIVGVEHYNQRYQNPPIGQPSARQTTADARSSKPPVRGAVWLGFRDVTEMDGKPVPDRLDRLQKLFKSRHARSVWKRGTSPTRARASTSARRAAISTTRWRRCSSCCRRASHASRSTEKARPRSTAWTDVWEIDFDEKSRPTLIRTSDGQDAPTHGTLWIVAADGTIVRTQVDPLRLCRSRKPLDHGCDVNARDPRLSLWLPAKMAEEYAGTMEERTLGRSNNTMSSLADQAVMKSTATYGDFKRFETGAAIK